MLVTLAESSSQTIKHHEGRSQHQVTGGVVVSGSGKMTPGTSVEGEASFSLGILKRLKVLHSLSVHITTLIIIPKPVPLVVSEGTLAHD